MLGIMLVVMFLVYSVYSIIVNKISCTISGRQLELRAPDDQNYRVSFIASFYSSCFYWLPYYKQLELKHLKIYGAILHCISMIIWLIIFIIFKRKQKEATKIKYEYPRASTFTVLFLNFPMDMSPEQLQIRINQYLSKFVLHQSQNFNNIKQRAYQLKQRKWKQFNVAFQKCIKNLNFKDFREQNKINHQYNLWIKKKYQQQLQNRSQLRIIQKINKFYPRHHNDQLKQIQKMIKQYKIKIKQPKKQFENLLKNRLNSFLFDENLMNEHYRHQKYKLFRQKLNQLNEKQQQIQEYNVEEQNVYNPAFVTFSSLWVLEFFMESIQKQKFLYQDHGKKAFIIDSPQPEDVIWQNMGTSISLQVWGYILLVSICFFLFLLIIIVQLMNILQSQQIYIRHQMVFLTFAGIWVFKMVLKIIFYKLSIEPLMFHSYEQASISIKGAIAITFPAIILPVFVSIMGFRYQYGKDGLAQAIQKQGTQNIFYQDYASKIRVDYDMKNPKTSVIGQSYKFRQKYLQNIQKMENITMKKELPDLL